jgi:alkanesulfonate monooxygenase SsuD/methylene tetrahydromethanopterin reductase-like flavin-dependent oxidoreductase (luciferase family)
MNLACLVASKDARVTIDAFRDCWKAANGGKGIQMPKAAVARNLYVGESDAKARERGSFGNKGFYESLVYLWRKYHATHASLDDVLRASESTLYTGTSATVRAQIEEDLEVSGADYFMARFAYGDLTHEESMRSLELFINEVMPHFRK